MLRRGGLTQRAALLAVVTSLFLVSFPVDDARAAGTCGPGTAQGAKASYPVLQTDKLDIVFLDGCALAIRWENSKRGGRDFSLWQPDSWIWDAFPATDGWRTPGDLPVSADGGSNWKLDPPENYVTFIVRPKTTNDGPTPNVMADPTSYSKVWNDDKSGGSPDIALFEPVCPDGYDALGLVSKPHSDDAPDPDTVTAGWLGRGGVGCVNHLLTYPMDVTKGAIDGAMWNSRGLSGSADIGLYTMQRPSSPASLKNSVILPSPTVWGVKDEYDAPPADKFRGLEMPITSPDLPDMKLTEPALTGNSAKNLEPQVVTDHFTISAMQTQDTRGYSSEIAKLRDSPVYLVTTSTQWTPVEGDNACPSGGPDCVISHAVGTSQNKTETWNNTVGVQTSVSVATEVAAKPAGVGTGWTLTFGLSLSYSHEFGGQSDKGTNETVTRQYTLHPGQYGHFFQSTTTYTEYRRNAPTEQNKVRSYTANGPFTFAAYPAPPPVMPGHFPVPALDGLQLGKQLFSATNDYYLVLTKGGALEVRPADEGPDQLAKGTWFMDKVHNQGKFLYPIDVVAFADGRLRVEAKNMAPWCSTTERHPGAQLEITKEGNLRVFDGADPRATFWNSKYDAAQGGNCA